MEFTVSEQQKTAIQEGSGVRRVLLIAGAGFTRDPTISSWVWGLCKTHNRHHLHLDYAFIVGLLSPKVSIYASLAFILCHTYDRLRRRGQAKYTRDHSAHDQQQL